MPCQLVLVSRWEDAKGQRSMFVMAQGYHQHTTGGSRLSGLDVEQYLVHPSFACSKLTWDAPRFEQAGVVVQWDVVAQSKSAACIVIPFFMCGREHMCAL